MNNKEISARENETFRPDPEFLDTDFSYDLAVEDGLVRPEDEGNWAELSQDEQDIHAIRRFGYDVIDRAIAPDNEHRLTGIIEAGTEIAHEVREVYKRKNDNVEASGDKNSVKRKFSKLPGIRRFLRSGDIEESVFDRKDHIPQAVGANTYIEQERVDD